MEEQPIAVEVKVDPSTEPNPVLAKMKRKYKLIPRGEFIRIANEEGTVKGVVEKTGMSYGGVLNKLRAMKNGTDRERKKVSLKASLFERQKTGPKKK